VENLALTIKIVVLWLFIAMAMSAHSMLAFMEREVVEQVWKMEMGPEMMLLMDLFWFVSPQIRCSFIFLLL